MNNFRRTALASFINLALISIPVAEAASTDALERRIKELEHRLAKQEQTEKRLLELEKRLERQGQATAQTYNNLPATNAAANPVVEKLTRKVNTLERKLEVQEEVATTNAQKQPILEAGAEGFKITSADKQHQLRIRGAVQADGRFALEDPNNLTTSTFQVKQARVWIEGYLWKDINYKIMPDFAASGNILPDAYLDYTYFTPVSLLAGKFKPSISLERLQGDSDTVFMERAYPTQLASNRDVGFQVHGSFAKPGYKTEKAVGPIDYKNFFTYQLGVYNGSGDGGSPNYNAPDTSLHTNNDKEFAGRLWAHPFQHTGYSWLEGLGFGIAGSESNRSNATISSLTTPLGNTAFFNYSTSMRAGYSAPTSTGTAYRIYPQAYWYAGPFGLLGEYVVSSQVLQSTFTPTGGKAKTVNVRQNNNAWQVQASYMLTGEDNTFGQIKPIRNFNPKNGGWGALQLAGRWTELNIANSSYHILDPTKAASGTTAFTLGFNWFLNQNALIRADYEHVNFKGGWTNGINRPTEQVFATRFQLAF